MNLAKKNLLPALAKLLPICGRRSTLPILSTVRMEAKDGVLSMFASDLDCLCEEQIECDGELEAVCVPASTLQATAAFGSDKQSYTLKDSVLHCDVGANVQIGTLKAEEFVQIQKDGGKLIGLVAKDLAEGIRSVLWAASDNNLDKPVLCSVNIAGTAKSLLVQSTDGRQFASFTKLIMCGDCDVVIPIDQCSRLADALEQKDATFSVSENKVIVNHKHGMFSCQLMNNPYPQTATHRKAKVKPVGTFSRDEWVNCFKFIKSIRNPMDDLCAVCSVKLSKKSALIEYVQAKGKANYSQEIMSKFEKCDLNLNALTFLDCLTAFPDESSVNLGVIEDFQAVCLELGDLRVLTTQLRGA